MRSLPDRRVWRCFCLCLQEWHMVSSMSVALQDTDLAPPSHESQNILEPARAVGVWSDQGDSVTSLPELPEPSGGSSMCGSCLITHPQLLERLAQPDSRQGVGAVSASLRSAHRPYRPHGTSVGAGFCMVCEQWTCRSRYVRVHMRRFRMPALDGTVRQRGKSAFFRPWLVFLIAELSEAAR